jgi:HTH-type transcriptional regulator/antitoxin HigA
MEIASIATRGDYIRALRKIEALMNARRNTPRGDCLDALVSGIEAWEAERVRLDRPGAGGRRRLQ